MKSINRISTLLNQLTVTGVAILLMTLTLESVAAEKEKYPQKPVRIVVGFSPGGPVDNISRIISKRLSEHLGQPFVIENKPGAGGSAAAWWRENASSTAR
jgi:tripartite-type tricarboxylate transporter receptor subunit TctC